MMFHIHKSCEMFNKKSNFVKYYYTKCFADNGDVELLHTTIIENVKKKEGLSLLLLSKAELDYEYT